MLFLKKFAPAQLVVANEGSKNSHSFEWRLLTWGTLSSVVRFRGGLVGDGLHEMNPCLFQIPAGAASTFEPFRIPALATLYTATISLFRRAVGSSGMVLRTLMGHTRFGLCLPSPCACIISQAVGLVKWFLKLFFGFFRRADLCTIAMASPCSALSNVPCEGWGSLPSPDKDIISYL